MTEIICAGFGGQGVLTAGMLLITAGMEQGKQVLFYPSYGSEMRGGTANCVVKISGKMIASPSCKHPDILVAMSGPAVDKFEKRLKPGGLLLANTSIVPKERKYRGDIRVVRVDATDIAQKIDNLRGANIVMLGALAANEPGLFGGIEALEKSIDAFFERKGKKNKGNRLCFLAGAEVEASSGA